MAGNQNSGIASNDTTAGVTVRTSISNTLVANNAFGILATGVGQATTINNTSVTGNQRGLFGGGSLLSFSNNFVGGNILSDGDPTGTVAQK